MTLLIFCLTISIYQLSYCKRHASQTNFSFLFIYSIASRSLNNSPRAKREGIAARGVAKVIPFQGFQSWKLKIFQAKLKRNIMATIKCYI